MSGNTNSAGPGNKADQSTDQILRQSAPYLTLGIQLAAGIVVFFLLGWWLDTKYDSSPMYKLVGLGVGMVGGLIKFLKTVVDLGKQETSAKPKP
ncbi:MAG TPA: AtpZ/AtpI family protein [Bacteroidota bacterium]|nr:AtpZ/AtpI family protein [Bacteroidota bacterium]